MSARTLPLWLGLILGGVAVVLGLGIGSDSIGQAQLAARYTARVSFPIFILTYSASSLFRLHSADWTRTLLRHRRQWGLGFAIAHTIHLGALVAYQAMTEQMPSLQTLVGGGGAYVMLYAMALTSNGAAMRALGIWWKRLHTFGIHWLWFIFAFSYFGRIFDPDRRVQGVILFAICLGALALRVAAWRKGRRPYPSR